MTDRVFKVLVGNDTNGSIQKCDGIEHDGKLWLVPRWFEIPALKLSKPARIVRFDNQQHQKVKPGSNFGDYVLNVPVPKVLLDPTPPPKQEYGFEYIEAPEIEVPHTVRPLRMGRAPGLN